MPASQFPFLDWLNEEPQVGYNTALAGLSRPMQQYFGSQFGNIRGEYLGSLGQQLATGQMPNTQWTDFLAANPFAARYARLSPLERGESQGRYNPFVRWG